MIFKNEKEERSLKQRSFQIGENIIKISNGLDNIPDEHYLHILEENLKNLERTIFVIKQLKSDSDR